nr:hypothetical protein [Myxococcales bacterium]
LRPDGKGALWTDALTPAAADRFVEQTGVGNIGQATEQGLNSVEEALTTQATLANAGFRRPDGQLAVVLIADEDDQSPQTPKSVVKTLEGLGSFTDDVTFSRVSGCKGFEHPRYEGVVDAIGGAEADLCDVDPAAFVADLTALWWTSNAYELTNTPDPTTLELWVDEGKGFVLLDASCWVYDAAFDTVRLSGCTLTAGTSIEARYD